jgi:thiol-disulfide isomerase/thioredoxin
MLHDVRAATVGRMMRAFVATLVLRSCRAVAGCVLGLSLYFSLLTAAYAGDLASVSARPLPKSEDRRLHEAIAAHAGKPILINFWATWCEPCRQEVPALQRFAERWRARGLVVLTVAVADPKQRAADFLWDNQLELPVIADPAQSLSRPWGARAVPTTLVLDRRHRVRLQGQGAIDWDAPALDRQFQPLFN